MPIEHSEYQNVTFETIDQAVVSWFDQTVDAHVLQPNGDRKKVVVNFSAGERWITARERRGLRDKNGVLILPLISLRRTGIEPSPTMSALGTETATLQISKRISPKTNDIQNLYKNRDPQFRTPSKPTVYEVTTIPFPDRSIISYEVQIQAQYITQMNTILEKMFHELDLNKSFVAPFENEGRHPPIGVPFEERKLLDKSYVVGFFDASVTDGGNFEEFTDQERIVRFNTSIRVPAVLQLDPEGEKPSVQVERTAFKLGFAEEKIKFVDDPYELELIFGDGKVREK